MTTFDRDQFLHYLGVYGADFSRWPERLQAEARAFLAQADEDVQKIYSKELTFDAFIAPAADNPGVPIGLETALIGASPNPVSGRNTGAGLLARLAGFRAPRWASATLAAVCLFGGAGTGYGVSIAEHQTEEVETLMAFAVVSTPSLLEQWATDSEITQ